MKMVDSFWKSFALKFLVFFFFFAATLDRLLSVITYAAIETVCIDLAGITHYLVIE